MLTWENYFGWVFWMFFFNMDFHPIGVADITRDERCSQFVCLKEKYFCIRWTKRVELIKEATLVHIDIKT